MAIYETGTATNPSDLVSKMIVFAEAQGWTVSSQTTTPTLYPGSNTPGRVFSKGTLVFGIGWSSNGIYVCGATGVNGSANWNAQTGSTITNSTGVCSWANEMPGPYQSYHFFAGTNPDYFHIVVELGAGIFRHIVFGSLVKQGTYTGGAYYGATYWAFGPVSNVYYQNSVESTYHHVPFDVWSNVFVRERWGVRADIDGATNKWFHVANTSPNRARGFVRNSGFGESLWKRSPSDFNQLTPLIPIPVMVERSSGSLFSPIGYAPDMRFLNITNFAPKDVLTIASDEWMIFPFVQKSFDLSGASSTQSTLPSNSGLYGFAYKRN